MRSTYLVKIALLPFWLVLLNACGGGKTEPQSFTVTAIADEGGSVSPGSRLVISGQNTTFTVTPSQGYGIANVTGCNGSLLGNSYTTGVITGACTVNASFSQTNYSVTATAGQGGSISPGSALVNHGATATFVVTPEIGYSLANVTGCNGSLNGNMFTTGPITSACSVNASFNLNSYVITATAGQGGSISPGSVTVKHGTSASFIVTPAIGYNIASVTGCNGSLVGDNYITGTVVSDCTVSATFELTPPKTLKNAFAKCGDWSQQLVGFTPPYTFKNHQRWLVMGSSSAFGAGASSYANSWAGKLTEYGAAEGIEVINIAKGGLTTYQGLPGRCEVSASRFQPDAAHNIDLALAYSPDLVVVSFPSNDAALGYSAEESAYNLLLMRELLAREDIVTVLIGAQPRNMAAERQRVLVELDQLLQERIKACLVEVYTPLVDAAGNLSASYNSGDGVHINNAGHAIVYERLLKTLTEPAAGCVM